MRTLQLLVVSALCVTGGLSQGLNGLPSCAQACVGSGVPDGCSATDIACICKDKAYQSMSACCIFSKCSGSDLQSAIAFANQLCAVAQVSVATTSPANCVITGGATPTATGATGSADNGSEQLSATLSNSGVIVSPTANIGNNGANDAATPQDLLIAGSLLALVTWF